MKKMILVLLLPAFLVACGGIQVTQDSFKNATVVTMKERYSSDESLIKGGGWAIFTFVREIKNNVPNPTEINIHVTKARVPFFGNLDLQNKAIVKVGDMASEVQLGDRSALAVTTYSRTGNAYSTSEHEEWTARFFLTKKIEDAALKSEAISFRFYFGEKPFTVILSKKDAEKVKEFLMTREKK